LPKRRDSSPDYRIAEREQLAPVGFVDMFGEKADSKWTGVLPAFVDATGWPVLCVWNTGATTRAECTAYRYRYGNLVVYDAWTTTRTDWHTWLKVTDRDRARWTLFRLLEDLRTGRRDHIGRLYGGPPEELADYCRAWRKVCSEDVDLADARSSPNVGYRFSVDPHDGSEPIYLEVTRTAHGFWVKRFARCQPG
jgi:hypothetical protein